MVGAPRRIAPDSSSVSTRLSSDEPVVIVIHLYKEIGTKQELGIALINRETDDFLAGMCEQLRAHPTDLVGGAGAAVRMALDYGSHNTLLKAILTAGDRGESLLPLLAARPDAVLARAKRVLAGEVAAIHPSVGLTPTELDVYIDGIVRLVLSHLTQRTGPPDDAVTQSRWLTCAATAPR